MKPLKALKPLGALRPLIQEPLPESSLPDPDSDNPEDASRQDHIAMMKGLREQQAEANKIANDAVFWFAAYFQTEQQKNEFIEALKLTTGGQYVDGLELADSCKVKLTPRTTKYKTGTLDKKCAALAR
jgi:hypothetical protein